MKLVYVIIFVLLIILINKIFFGYYGYEYLSNNDIKYWDFNYGSGLKIGFMGSVHGNEPAGCVGLGYLINSGYFNKIAREKKIFIRVIPCINEWGIKRNSRYQPDFLYPDINRNFIGEGLEPVSQKVINLVKDLDWLIDIHEGYSYHLIDPKSVGSTLSPGPMVGNIAELMVQEVNKTIPDPNKKFVVLNDNNCKIPKTMACYRKSSGKKYILIEISGQNDIQPIGIRKNQVIILVQKFLEII